MTIEKTDDRYLGRTDSVLSNMSSCLKCGILVLPADDGKIYQETHGANVGYVITQTEDGYKKIKGYRPTVHVCDEKDLQKANSANWENFIKNKSVIILDKLRNTDEKVSRAIDVSCPKCKAEHHKPCKDMTPMGQRIGKTNKHVHQERITKGFDVIGYEVTWHADLGRIAALKGLRFPK